MGRNTSGQFNVDGWRTLMLDHPEAARYLGQAQEIETFLKNRGTPFPSTFKEMRAVILDYSLQRLGLEGSETAQNLQLRFAGKSPHVEFVELETSLRLGTLVTIGIRPDRSPALDNLMLLGVLGGSTLCEVGYKGVMREVPVIIDESGIRASLDSFGRYDRPRATHFWRYESIQTILEQGDTSDLKVLCQILKCAEAVPIDLEVKIYVNTRSLADDEAFELRKQILINAIAMGVPPKTLFGDNYLKTFNASTGQTTQGRVSDTRHASPEEAIEMIVAAQYEEDIPELISRSPISLSNISISFEQRVPDISAESMGALLQAVDRMVHTALEIVRRNGNRACAPVKDGVQAIYDLSWPILE